MSLHSKSFKKGALALSVFAALSLMVPSVVDARGGSSRSSSGSRGSHSSQSVPNTPTSSARTTSPSAPNQMGRAPMPQQQGSMMSRLGMGFAAGLLGAGLFGMLSGSGFMSGLGSLMGMIGFLLQLAIIFFIARFALNYFRKKQQPAAAGAPVSEFQGQPQQGYGSQAGYASAAAPVQQQPQRVDEVGIEANDYQAFENLLVKVQDAYGREALGELKTLVGEALYKDMAEDIADNTRRGIHNQCGGAKLLQGDLAESWREGTFDYATVTLRYSIFDVTRNRASGQVVEGSMETPLEAVEHWTFKRATGGQWTLEGIDQA